MRNKVAKNLRRFNVLLGRKNNMKQEDINKEYRKDKKRWNEMKIEERHDDLCNIINYIQENGNG